MLPKEAINTGSAFYLKKQLIQDQLYGKRLAELLHLQLLAYRLMKPEWSRPSLAETVPMQLTVCLP